MRADRLLSLLLLLQARGRMTAHELAEYLEVSERTIYRDIDALSAAGIPVYTERGPGGGCELIDGYQTKLTGLTEIEVRALFLLNATGPLTDLGLDQALDDALLKLSVALPVNWRSDAMQVRQRIHIDTTSPHRSQPPYLRLIQEAVWQERTLWLTYEMYSRQYFDPYGLVFKANAWYLIGAVTGEIQALRVTYIKEAEMTEQHFQRPPDFDLATSWKECNVHRALASQRKKQKMVSASPVVASVNYQRKKTKIKGALVRGYERTHSAYTASQKKIKIELQETLAMVYEGQDGEENSLLGRSGSDLRCKCSECFTKSLMRKA